MGLLPSPQDSDANALNLRTEALERAEAKNARLAVIYGALTAVHAHATRAESGTKLFTRACTALVKGRCYGAAWLGVTSDLRTLRITVNAGDAVRFPDKLVSPRADTAGGRVGHDWQHALRTNLPVPCTREDLDSPWVQCMRRHDLSAAVMVPLRIDANTRAVLCVASSCPEAFSQEEIDVLMELGRSLTAHSERIAAERALATQRELLRAVFDCASYGIYYATSDGTMLLCNDAFLRLVGTPRDRLIGKSYQSITPSEYHDIEKVVIERVITTGLSSEFDKELLRSDGFRIPVRLSVAPVRDRAKRAVGTVTIVRDTVAEREAAAALRESEERYRAAFRSNPSAIFVVDVEDRIVDANPAATALTGLARDELISRQLLDLMPSEEAPKHAHAMANLANADHMFRSPVKFDAAVGGIVDTEVHATLLAPRLWQVICRDITARVQAETKLLALNEMLEEKVAARTRELEEANQALSHAGRMKDEFLANMSHELRTPLNSVLGLSDALLDGVFGDLDDQQRQILMTMHDSGRHLLELINDILDLSKIDAGRLEIDIRSISVTEVCQASLRMVRPLAINKRIETWMRIDPNFPVVVADERRLKQMLVNLLSNGVKFTPKGGQGGVETWTVGKQVYFSVIDTGIGIDTPNLRKVFEPFTQIDSSLARQHEGTGLGLALVRKLAELHGGYVDVHSEPGRGSRFTIVLPVIDPPERDSIPAQEM